MYKPVVRMSINALILPKASNSYIFGMKIESILPEEFWWEYHHVQGNFCQFTYSCRNMFEISSHS